MSSLATSTNNFPSPTVQSETAWTTVLMLSWREWIRFVRQPNRVVGAVGQPVLFWLLFGAGLGPSFSIANLTAQNATKTDAVIGNAATMGNAALNSAALSYSEYYFPGTLVLILLFTAIFATISVIEDRREGFLQAVLVAPAPRWAMVLGKLLGGTAIAIAQAGLFFVLGSIWGMPLSWLNFVPTMLVLAMLGVALTALGFTLAWQLDSTQGFHAIMSVFLLPMWLLSGSFFPPGDNWIGWLVRLNPLTYGVALVRRMLYCDRATSYVDAIVPNGWMSLFVTILFLAVTLAAAWWSAGRRTAGDLL